MDESGGAAVEGQSKTPPAGQSRTDLILSPIDQLSQGIARDYCLGFVGFAPASVAILFRATSIWLLFLC